MSRIRNVYPGSGSATLHFFNVGTGCKRTSPPIVGGGDTLLLYGTVLFFTMGYLLDRRALESLNMFPIRILKNDEDPTRSESGSTTLVADPDPASKILDPGWIKISF